ncbi:MAG: hypothetical protein R3270_00270 [Gammaproteobacteria bacterium]|nr:hypothetical protein [Gammaproteobacteria bacterium]
MNTTQDNKSIRTLLAGLLVAVSLATFPAMAEAKVQAKPTTGTVSLATAIRMQMEISQQNILAEQRYQLKQMPLLLDNPGVTVGPLEVIETAGAEQDHERPVTVSAATSEAQASVQLAEDILAKALRAPGLMGLSRYIALPALELALESAK